MDNLYAGRPVRIVRIARHTDSEWSFTLDVRVPVAPGQFVMVSVPQFGEVPLAVSGFGSDGIDITVRKVGKVTAGIFQKWPGDELYVRGPYGRGFPADVFENDHLLIIAGGSGLAAVKSLIEHCLAVGPDRGRRLDVLVGFRSPKHVLFKKDLAAWARNAHILVTVDRHEDVSESWAGGIGFVVEYVKHVEGITPDTRCIVVGPPLMMRNTIQELIGHRVRQENIWLSFERHMKCGVGKCGHCRIGDKYVCLDGPVFNYVVARRLID